MVDLFQKTSRLSQSFAVLSNHRNDLPAVEFGVEEFFGLTRFGLASRVKK